jgi:hypothetical protein
MPRRVWLAGLAALLTALLPASCTPEPAAGPLTRAASESLLTRIDPAAPTPRHRGPAGMEGRPAGCGPAGLAAIPILRVGTSSIDPGADCRYDGEQGARQTGPRLNSLTVDMRGGRSCPARLPPE